MLVRRMAVSMRVVGFMSDTRNLVGIIFLYARRSWGEIETAHERVRSCLRLC